MALSSTMPNKRSKRKKIRKYFCPYCEQRLWRLGNTKHYLYYKNANEIKHNTGMTLKKAKLLSLQNSTYLDDNKWIEAFCCSDHGMMWILISVQSDDYNYQLATRKDWSQTNKTIDPSLSNPSVSEFTLRMSRKLH